MTTQGPITNKVSKETLKVAKIKAKAANQIKIAKAKQEAAEAKYAAKRATVHADTLSSNPIKRAMAKHAEASTKAHETKIRSMEAKAKTAELSPQMALNQQRTEAGVRIAKAKSHGKMVGYAALAKGAATLGQGLTDEGNRDDKKYYDHVSDIIKTITGNDTDSGMKQGVL